MKVKLIYLKKIVRNHAEDLNIDGWTDDGLQTHCKKRKVRSTYDG